MQELVCGKYKIVKLSKEDIASYFERAYNHPAVQGMLNNSTSLGYAQSNFNHFGNILQAYVTATGDLSDNMIEKLSKDFEKNVDELRQPFDEANKLESTQKYFANHVLPYVFKHHAKKFGMEEPLSLTDTAQILQAIRLNCFNNRFQTHSFNGALFDEIKNNGFDISKEMFLKEFDVLKKVGLYQPYQTGNLLFCELSKATFGYVPYAPERVSNSVGRTREQTDTETIREFYTQSLQNALDGKNLDDETKQKALAAGQRIIDFYYGGQQASAIAFMPVGKTITDKESTSAVGELYFELSSYRTQSKISTLCGDNETLKTAYQTALRDIVMSGKCEAMEGFIKKFNRLHPENNVFEAPLKKAIVKAVTKNCLNNFVYNGCADGYRIESGKLSPNEFSLAYFPNPIEQYVLHNKQALAIEKEKLMAEEYNRERYNEKYMIDIKKGTQPKESFADYCAHNATNTHYLTALSNGLKVENPKYKQWKKEKGYLNTESKSSQLLETRARERIRQQKEQNKSSSIPQISNSIER